MKKTVKTAKQPTISIIVTARNYGKFLEECLTSCLNQTVKPLEVIYSDDCSDDNSVAIARKIKGVTVVENKTWIGVVKARNAGVQTSTGEALVHVDGDDTLPPDFLEKHLSVFDKTTPFVYCAAQAFGLKDNFWRVPEWKETSIWVRNYVNTSTMMWRWVFDACGGWQETVEKTMWDWSLAIRASRMLKTNPKPSPAILNYRFHGNSSSDAKRKEEIDYIIQHRNIRKELVTMSICCIYGGRNRDMMSTWLDTLIADVSILKNKPELIIINNSQKPIHWITSYHKQYFSDIKIIRGFPALTWGSEQERRLKVSTLLADCHNLALKYCTGDLIHFREDDMLTNAGTFERMFNFITDIYQDKRKASVSALYLNRHHPRIVGGKFNYQQPELTREIREIKNNTPISVDFTGTGCMMYWKDKAPAKWFPTVSEKGICAHDWRFGVDLKAMGGDIYILPDAVCKHVRGLIWDWVEPECTKEIGALNYTKSTR